MSFDVIVILMRSLVMLVDGTATHHTDVHDRWIWCTRVQHFRANSQSHTKWTRSILKMTLNPHKISLSRKRTMKTVFIFISDLFNNTLILSLSISVVIVLICWHSVFGWKKKPTQPTNQRTQQIHVNFTPIRHDQKKRVYSFAFQPFNAPSLSLIYLKLYF